MNTMDLERGLFGTYITSASSCPMVFKHAVDDWQSRHWTPEYLCNILGDKLLDCKISIVQHEEFQWEPDCLQLKIRMRHYVDWLHGKADCDNPLRFFDKTKYSCYIDYKYMKEMFKEQPHLLESVCWDMFGLTDYGGEQSTIWIGSCGTYTPCHQDTYGFNLVAQIQGRKRWYLFNPVQTNCMYPTRIPYEESSIYSEVNVRYPDLARHPLFQKTTPYVIELGPGDVLYVPRHWWHFVESLEPSISINTWVPVVEDIESQMEESVTRLLYTCLSSTLLSDTERRTCLNTGEELQRSEVNLHYLQTTVKTLLSQKPCQGFHDYYMKTCEISTAESKQNQLDENCQPRENLSNLRNNWQKFCDKFQDYTITVVCLCGIDSYEDEQHSRSAGRKRKYPKILKNDSDKEVVEGNHNEMRIKLRKTNILKVEQIVDINELEKKNIHEENVHPQEDICNASYENISKERGPESSITVEDGLEKDVSLSSGQRRDSTKAYPLYSLSTGKTNESVVEIYAAKHFTFLEYVNFLEKVFDYKLKPKENCKTVDVSNIEADVDENVQVNDTEIEQDIVNKELSEQDIVNTELSIETNNQSLASSNTDRNTGDAKALFYHDQDIDISTVDIMNSILDPSVIKHIGHVLLNKIRK